MKIAYLSRGHSVYDRRFLEKMVERGHQPTLISYFPSEKVQVMGVPVLHYDITSLLRFPRLSSFQIAWHLRGVLKELAPDVLHTGWVNDCGFYGALSGFHPMLSMPWGSDVLVFPDHSYSTRWIVRFVLRRADRIACDCQTVRNKIIELSGCQADKIVVFPWGVDLSVFRPLEGPSRIRQQLRWEENQILIMTRVFKPIYGIEYFIETLPMVIAQRPKARVVLVGSGPLEASYRRRIKELGLERYVHFAGWMDERGMAAYLNAADIYVTTSLSDGTSCSLLEAMACGLPVVVSDAPAYFEWVEDGGNGYIVPRKDSVVLSERLVELLGDGDLRQAMGEHNLQLSRERADWDKNFDKLERLYNELVFSHSAKRS